MNGYIMHNGQDRLSLPADEVRRLLDRADGDASLLYLYLQSHPGGVEATAVLAALHWSETRLTAAEETLRAIAILRGGEVKEPASAEERQEYSREEIANLLEGDASFRAVLRQVEEKLGKKLKTADLQILAGLYDDLGFPADVLYLLVCHCIRRSQQRYGEGRKPTLRQIEKEGYYWQRRGLMTQQSADEYLRRCAAREGQLGGYMHALQLGDRAPVESEERYLIAWMDMGFSPEAVALAYDRTVFYKKELKWSYLNGILRRWHEEGRHTVEEIRAADRPAGAKPAPASGGKNDWMKQYTKK